MFSWDFFVTHIFNLGPFYINALIITISLAVIGQIVGILIGGLLTIARLSHSRFLSGIAFVYTWFFRGVPELVLLVLFFSGFAAAGLFRFQDFTILGITFLASFQAAIVAIGLREGAYMGEIIRTGVLSVRTRQIEAARSLGLPPRKVLRHVTLPQAMRVIVPPFGNDFNVMLKVTSLASVIGVPELFLVTQTFASATFRTFELFFGLAINYLILTTVWSIIQSIIEERLQRHEPNAKNISLFQSILNKLRGTSSDLNPKVS